ncbi:MAG: hypothetical protein IJ196_07950 [Prevotella sp.]|nr:hypothetical protein [Prevotella sp.]
MKKEYFNPMCEVLAPVTEVTMASFSVPTDDDDLLNGGGQGAKGFNDWEDDEEEEDYSLPYFSIWD